MTRNDARMIAWLFYAVLVGTFLLYLVPFLAA
jgi:hypothetical protein